MNAVIPTYGQRFPAPPRAPAPPRTPPPPDPFSLVGRLTAELLAVGVSREAADELVDCARAAMRERNGRPASFVAAIRELREAGEYWQVSVAELERLAVSAGRRRD